MLVELKAHYFLLLHHFDRKQVHLQTFHNFCDKFLDDWVHKTVNFVRTVTLNILFCPNNSLLSGNYKKIRFSK